MADWSEIPPGCKWRENRLDWVKFEEWNSTAEKYCTISTMKTQYNERLRVKPSQNNDGNKMLPFKLPYFGQYLRHHWIYPSQNALWQDLWKKGNLWLFIKYTNWLENVLKILYITYTALNQRKWKGNIEWANT